MNALVVVAIVNIAKTSRAKRLNELQYTARVIGGSVEAHLQRYLAAARALSASPHLLGDDLNAFRQQAETALPDRDEARLQVSDPEGHKLFSMAPLQTLSQRSPAAKATQDRAFAIGSPIVSGVLRAPIHEDWVTNIEFPIFRDGKPFRELSIGITANSFSRLLQSQHLPEGWIAGIADADGRYVARVPDGGLIGQSVSPGWAATLQKPGLSKFNSREGDEIINANEVSPLSGWTIAVAVKERMFDAPIWSTLKWSILAGSAVSLVSLAAAVSVARKITESIRDLETKASALVGYQPVSRTGGLPEIEHVWDALQTALAERQRSEEELRSSEELLRTAAEAARFGAYEFDAITGRLLWSPQLKHILGVGFATGEISRVAALSYIHPEDREQAEALFSRVAAGREPGYEVEFRVVRPDGEVLWVINRGRTILDPQTGRVTRMVGIVIDITARKLAELHQKTLLLELSHRVKNTLAIVQSISRQTLRNTRDPIQFASVFSDRLMSLARAHDLLTRSSWEGAALEAIVKDAIAPFLSSGRESAFHITGTAVDVSANTTITLSLMFHELLTNAMKHGALSSPAGRVTIEWETIKQAGREDITLWWIEQNGPPFNHPVEEGFGMRLLKMSAEQLDGQIEIDYDPGGLRCHLRFPLRARGDASL